jgi:glutaredoxin
MLGAAREERTAAPKKCACPSRKETKNRRQGRGMLEVRIFVLTGCPFCERAVAQASGVPGVYVRAEEVDPEVRERLARETGCRTLPSVWVRGAYVGGLETGPPPFGGLARMIASGKLRKLSEEHARAQRR